MSREPAATVPRRTDMADLAQSHVSRRVGVLAAALALGTLAITGCAQGSGTTLSASGPSSSPSSPATAVPAPTVPAPVTTGPTTGSILTPPPAQPRPGSGGNAVPPGSTVLVASMIAQTLAAVTDKNIYGPVTLTDAARVSKVAAVINSAPPRVPAIVRCPMQGTGNLTLVFERSVNGPAVATVVISTSGCPGMIVHTASGGVIGFDGGPDTVREIESILGVPWPQPAG